MSQRDIDISTVSGTTNLYSETNNGRLLSLSLTAFNKRTQFTITEFDKDTFANMERKANMNIQPMDLQTIIEGLKILANCSNVREISFTLYSPTYVDGERLAGSKDKNVTITIGTNFHKAILTRYIKFDVPNVGVMNFNIELTPYIEIVGTDIDISSLRTLAYVNVLSNYAAIMPAAYTNKYLPK